MITELTADQTAQIDIYVKKWIDIGLSTKTASTEETKTIVENIYKNILNLPVPEIKIMRSPMDAWNYIQTVIGKKIDFVWPYLSGSFDANTFAFYDYCFEVLNVEVPKEIRDKFEMWKATSILGLIFPFDDVCIVTEKPIKISRKDTVLHCEDGPAVEYSDGFSIYMLNGIRMKKKHVMTPWNELDAKEILKESNAEIRRELVRKIGTEKMIEQLGAEVIDVEGDYELLEMTVTFPEADESTHMIYLKMKNPSIGCFHIEGVHPDCRTVADALKFRNGTTEKPIQLT